MSQIKIKVDPNLIGDEGKMNRKTWKAIKQKKGNSIFFPEGDLIPMVSDEFELQFVLHIVDDEIDDNTMYVSPDVKQNRYPTKNTINY